MILRNPSTSPLLTDLYQLTMLQSYLEKGMHDVAVFEFFVRRLPENRGFLLFSGLETLLTFIEGMRFTEDDRSIWPPQHASLLASSSISNRSGSAETSRRCRKEPFSLKPNPLSG